MSESESVQPDNVGVRTALINTPETPEGEYTRRLGERRQQLAGVGVLHRRLWTYLIVIALAGVSIAYATLSLHLIPISWILLPSTAFLSIIQSLTKNARVHSRVQRIVSFYELGVTRLCHEWQGRGIGVRNSGETTIHMLSI